MLNRKTIAAIALVATGVAAPAFADDGDVRHAKILLEQARTYGNSGISGLAAGQTDATREARATRDDAKETLDKNEARWRSIARSQSLN